MQLSRIIDAGCLNNLTLNKVFIAGLLSFFFLLAQTGYATDVKLVCPCEYSSHSLTSTELVVGAKNFDTSNSNALRIRIIAHNTRSMFESLFYVLGILEIPDTLSAGETLANSSYLSGFIAPGEEQSFVSIVLEESGGGGWIRRDSVRMEPAVAINGTGGESLSPGQVFWDGTPTVEISGDSANLVLPPVRNNSTSGAIGEIAVEVRATEASEYWGSPSFNVAEYDYGSGLEAGGISTEITTTVTYKAPRSGFDTFHLLLIDRSTNQTLALETVQLPTGSLPTRSFNLASIELTGDTDADSVSDFNESIVSTNPNDSTVVPGKSTIDLLILYSQSVPGLYGGDPNTRIQHMVNYANEVLANSGVDIDVRIAESQQVQLDESLSVEQVLIDATERTNGFTTLDTIRSAHQSDIVVVVKPDNNVDEFCGIANLTGFATQGDFPSTTDSLQAIGVVGIDCSDNVLVHELGHVMGLTHAARQDPAGGTFSWSRGHGIDQEFVTVMSYASAFGDALEIDLFSDPALDCSGSPCGVDTADYAAGANAVLSLNTTRFQVANFDTNSISQMTGLWYIAAESGWGVTVTQQFGIVFVTLFTYNESGEPTWYVASNCTVVGSGCSGDLYEVIGGAPLTGPWNANTSVTDVGSISFNFADRNNGTMTVNINGKTGVKQIIRQVFSTISGSSPMTGLWFNASEAGWGVTLTQQSGIVFVTIFTYDNSGVPIWYVASNCAVVNGSCSGILYQVTGGSAITDTWDGSNLQVTAVGTFNATFTDNDTGTMEITIDSLDGNKAIERQIWATK